MRGRFLMHGRHTGPYHGNPPSGREFETSGHVTLRFEGGTVAESWFDYDLSGALEQVGALPSTTL